MNYTDAITHTQFSTEAWIMLLLAGLLMLIRSILFIRCIWRLLGIGLRWVGSVSLAGAGQRPSLR